MMEPVRQGDDEYTAARNVAWRAGLLSSAGLSADLSRAVAGSVRHDVHRLIRLLEQGCPVAVALNLTASDDWTTPA